MLNGPDAQFLTVREVPGAALDPDRAYFVRPVSDSKEIAGRVQSGAELTEIARKVLTVAEADIPGGSLEHDTELMLCPPARIRQEWRVWVVGDRVVTYSLYVERGRVIYRPEIDEDALRFAEQMVAANQKYAPAYVIDICRTEDGLRLLETNCLNAAGFYAADLDKLVRALEDLSL